MKLMSMKSQLIWEKQKILCAAFPKTFAARSERLSILAVFSFVQFSLFSRSCLCDTSTILLDGRVVSLPLFLLPIFIFAQQLCRRTTGNINERHEL